MNDLASGTPNEALRQPPAVRHAENELRDMRRAMLNLLEDLDDDRARLAQAERQWRAAFDAVRDALFMHDGIGRLLRINGAYRDLAAKPAQAMIGKPYWESFPPFPISASNQHDDGWETEFSVDAATFRARTFRVRDEKGNFDFYITVLEDISERRRSEAELRHRNQEITESNRALKQSLANLRAAEQALMRSERLATMGALAASVAHELNNPLMGLLNYVEYAREKMSDGRGKEVLDKATRELLRMRDFVKEMLQLAHTGTEQPLPITLTEPLDRTLDLLGADLRKRHITVVRELPAALPPVYAAAAPLQQVFINLLMNAADAMERSAHKVIHIGAELTARQVRIAISDTGVGIAKEFEARLFEPFFTTKSAGRGTGLGLSISQRIMGDLGGSLEYLRRDPPGATFIVTLRRADIHGKN